MPTPAPPAAVSRFVPGRAAAAPPVIQQACEQQPPVIQQPPVQQAYGQPPSGLQTASQQPFVQLPSEQAPVYPQPSLPSNPGLDAPEPVIVPVTPVNTANSNSPVSGSGPIRQTTDWSPAPQSTPAPLSAAPQPVLTQPAVAQTPASQTPAPWSSATWFHATDRTAAAGASTACTSASSAGETCSKACGRSASELVRSSDPQFQRSSGCVAVAQSGRRTDDHSGALPTAPTDAAAAVPSH